VLRAQKAVQTLAVQAYTHGAKLVRGRATPDGDAVIVDEDGPSAAGGGRSAAPGGGASAAARRLEADAVVWACGGWLAQLFPGLASVKTTRQDLFFMDGGEEWTRAPGWVDYDGAVYGTGDLDGLGVKGAPDFEGPPLAPDDELPLRAPGDNEPWIRDYFAHRFPELAAAPLKGSTSCRYELSPDSHFIAAEHPEHAGVWLVGGGSGHGFKHGPAMAERLAAALRGGEPMPERYKLGAREAGHSMRTAGSNPGEAGA